MDYDLGYFDDETCRLDPIENPFAAKVCQGGTPVGRLVIRSTFGDAK
jgi:hypothetical protein